MTLLEKIHLANPELKELSMGCVIKKKVMFCKIVAKRNDYEDGDEYILTKGLHLNKKYLHDNIFIARIDREDEIVGHLILPHHILRALGPNWAMAGDGQFLRKPRDDDPAEEKFPKYNLDLSFEEQEIHEWLNSVIK